MPKRIPFHVVYATSEDSNYPACELNAQGPATRGWRTEGSQPPHELLLRLAVVARIHRLQILAHHQLVPEWVEVLVSGGLMSDGSATPCGAQYTSVGRVALAMPPLHNSRTRELRSAAFPEPTTARFVKLRLSGPHVDIGDGEVQVALMAVNILGEEAEDFVDQPSPGASCQAASESSYSPYDDLAFVMYVDNDIADLVRRLDAKKRVAVAEERFEYARRLKSAGSALSAAGVRVGRWRLRKRTAAARDQFELARAMRDRIVDALASITADPRLQALFEEDGPDPRNDSSVPLEYDFSCHLSPTEVDCVLTHDMPAPLAPDSDHTSTRPPPDPEYADDIHEEVEVDEQNEVEEQLVAQAEEVQPPILLEPVIKQKETARTELTQKKVEADEQKRETDSPRRSVTPNAANGSLVRRRNKSAGPRSTFEAYEERLLPALRHSHTNEYLKESREESGSGAGSAGHPRVPHKLNERERKQAALPILIFGYPLVEKFYSKNYLDKEEGLAQLRLELTSPSAGGSSKTSPNKTARAAAVLLQRALRDKVFSVYSQANEVVRALFQEFMPDKVCSAEVGRCVERLLPELLRACGDPAPRVHSTAQHTVLTVADCPHVRSLHLIPQQLVRPVAAAMHPRLALSRLQMLEQLLLSQGITTDKNSGMTVRRVAECGAAGVGHASGAVRAAAERILLAAYARSPRVVRAQLPPDDAVTRRNLIYRHLYQQFDRIDTQVMLNQAPTDEQLLNGIDQSRQDSLIETASVDRSVRSRISTATDMTSSLGMTSSVAATSSYSIKSMASSVSGATLAPSSLSGSLTSSKTKSSLKKSPTKRYTPSKTARDFANYPGYNKLRLDSATSPKHSPKTPSGNEKVHFEEHRVEAIVYRKVNRHTGNRHSMIHYDHDSNKPQLKERPITVYEPLHLDYRDSSTLGSPKTSKTDVMSVDSLNTDSPQTSRHDLRWFDSEKGSDYIGAAGLDSPKTKSDYFKDPAPDSPRMTAGLKNLHLEDNREMDESGYYSPGDTRGKNQAILRSKSGAIMTEYCDQHFDSFEAGGVADVSSGGTTPEPVCNQCTWCGRLVRSGGLDAHYWRRCVVLARCSHCHMAVEARILHRHLLDECSSAGSWKKCHNCGAALRVNQQDYHPHCIPVGQDEWKCPYCLMNILARDLPWQRHLMQCPRNPRATSGDK